MTVRVPIEFNQEIIDELFQLMKQRLKEEEDQQPKTNELPPYPTRKQLKQHLKIGDARLNSWINHGLKTIPFGKETRFDREDVKQFLDSLKI
ncbi:DNA-binding protein [Listeria innocua]|uniref:DNA-binding protein n=1 Tax=Listeria innocua TaxID=1642 RepID=UPI0016240EC7|nr:DNA-binding protein [Listeria innocua]MBC1910874.1 DNA-binding protein [Listeria innocua]MBC1928813.1 DNA-binding protein [Listeria innocua]